MIKTTRRTSRRPQQHSLNFTPPQPHPHYWTAANASAKQDVTKSEPADGKQGFAKRAAVHTDALHRGENIRGIITVGKSRRRRATDSDEIGFAEQLANISATIARVGCLAAAAARPDLTVKTWHPAYT